MKEAKLRGIIYNLSMKFEVSEPNLWLVYNLPSEGVPKGYSLNKHGHGFYNPDEKEIVIEIYKPTDGKKYSAKAIFHCLAHEFVHHLEYTKIGICSSHRGKFAAMVRKVKKIIKGFNND